MSISHTPGPWLWRHGGYLTPEAHLKRALGFSVHENQNREYYATVIALPGTWGGADEEERAANARLIAAAPELLAAANEAFDFLGGIDGASEIRSTLLAAISKATSRQPEGERHD